MDNNNNQNYQPQNYQQPNYQQQNYQPQNYQQPNYQPQNYQQPNYTAVTTNVLHGKAKAFGIVSLACGIASIVGLFYTFYFGIPGIVFGVLAKKAAKEQGVENKMAKAGFVLSIIGLVVGIIALIAYIAFWAYILSQKINHVSNAYDTWSSLSSYLD